MVESQVYSEEQVDVSWILRLIVEAALDNAQFDPMADWWGIAAAAHVCLHSVGQTCTLSKCVGPDMKLFARFVDRHT